MLLFHFDDENTTPREDFIDGREQMKESSDKLPELKQLFLEEGEERLQRTFGRADFNDHARFPNFEKYILEKHVRVTQRAENVYEVEVMREKVCVWVFSPLEEGEVKEDFVEGVEGVWQKIEREERAVVVRGNNGIVFSFFPPRWCPDDAKVFRNRFKLDECVGAWRVSSSRSSESSSQRKEGRRGQKQTCLVLTGTSGSGKSTIAKGLTEKKWTVVNQDTIGSYCEKESGPVRDESEARAHARSTRGYRSNEYECRAKEEVCGRGGIRPGE